MPHPQTPYWSRESRELLLELGSGAGGLSASEAAERLRAAGANAVEPAGHRGPLGLLLRQVANPLVLILIFGACVSLLVQEWVDAAIILTIVLGSVLLGFVQEYRASAAVNELRQRLALTVRARRDGLECAVPAGTVVAGDVVLLSAGNLVPGDGLVLEARDLLVTEASLTGESFPVEKRPGTVPADTTLAARTNCVHLGTSVRSGTATVLIVHTGRDTALGAIADRLATPDPESDFARGLRQFGYLLVRVMLVIVVFVLVVNQWLGRPPLESLLFAMALAVGMSPELLPAIVTVTLARGAREMARRGVLVPRLEAIENLGGMDILCTDKTGTLTTGLMAVQAALGPDGQPAPSVLKLAFLNAAFETGIENPLDAALLVAGGTAGLTTSGYSKVDEIPYDFIRKRLTIVVALNGEEGNHLIVSKGAVASILGICASVAAPGGDRPLDPYTRGRLETLFRQKSEAGLRVLAVAVKRAPALERYGHDEEAGMTFAGFLLFEDPPKDGAAKAIRDLAALGVRVKIITGDNRHVAAHVATVVGLDPAALVTGGEIAAMKDEALWQRAEATTLFVEVDPQQKERIVRALKARGHAVGYLGDGINDAPALHAADVGISVDKAVDVARESADVVLLEPDLDALRRGVEDGRRTFANTLKYIGITTSANFGNMVSMALATPLLPFLPLAAKQILLNNILSDIPSVFISTDNVDPERLQAVPRWRVQDVRRFMLVFGLVSTVFDLLTFAVLLLIFAADEPVFRTTWFIVSLLTELMVVLVLRTEGSMFRSQPGHWLLWTTVAISLLALLVPWMGPVAALFGFVPLPPALLATGVAIVAAYVLVTELVKRRFYRQRPARPVM